MPTIQIDTVFNIELEFELAPFPKRLLAYVVDFFLMIIYMLAMKMILYGGNMGDFSNDSIGLDILVVTFPMLIYSLCTEVLLNGQTLGKKIMGIRVVSLDGGVPTLSQYMLRWVTKFFEWPFLFGFVVLTETTVVVYCFMTGFLGIAVVITILVTRKRQRLGDLAAGTVVVNTKTYMGLQDTVFMNVSENYSVTYPQVMRLSDNDINTIKNVLSKNNSKHHNVLHDRVAHKIYEVLQLSPAVNNKEFLQKLLEDYNYLATRER